MQEQDFHYTRARELLSRAEELVTAETVQAAVSNVAAVLNQRFDTDAIGEFPLVLGASPLGVRKGAVSEVALRG